MASETTKTTGASTTTTVAVGTTTTTKALSTLPNLQTLLNPNGLTLANIIPTSMFLISY